MNHTEGLNELLEALEKVHPGTMKVLRQDVWEEQLVQLAQEATGLYSASWRRVGACLVLYGVSDWETGVRREVARVQIEDLRFPEERLRQLMAPRVKKKGQARWAALQTMVRP